MVWDMQDYPASLKNFDKLLRKKIIDIANALVEAGYEDNAAIPIATEQGKEWYDNASDKELQAFKAEANPSKDDNHDTEGTNPDLLDENVQVYYEDKEWKVKTVKAQRAAETFTKKEDALDRAREIANNKGTKVISYTKDGRKQE